MTPILLTWTPMEKLLLAPFLDAQIIHKSKTVLKIVDGMLGG